MPAALTREFARGNQFVRQWRILVLLRRGGRTIDELARECGCTTRTVRRELEVLQAARLPIYAVQAEEVYGPTPVYWRIHPFAAWPAGELSPVEDLRP